MKLLGGMILGLLLAFDLRADALVNKEVGVSIEVPAGWSIGTEKETLIPPPRQLEENRMRQIHIVAVKGEPASLKEAIENEIAHISERERTRTGRVLDDHQGHLSSLPIITKSGIEGLKADFGSKDGERFQHAIVKYYFRNQEGRIFKVCVHVYGDDFLDKSYEGVVVQGLRLTQPGN